MIGIIKDIGNSLIEDPQLLIVVFLFYMMFNKLNMYKEISADYQTRKTSIKNEITAKLNEKVKGVLRAIKNTSSRKAENLLKHKEMDPVNHCPFASKDDDGRCTGCNNILVEGDDCILFNDKENLKNQYLHFHNAVKDALNEQIFPAIINAVNQNGFHNLDPSELNTYLDKKSNYLLELSRETISSVEHLFPCLKGTEEQRFSIEETKLFFRDIVEFYIELENEEREDLEELEKEYNQSINFKLPNIKKIIINLLDNKN
jgi:hypothetical protein